MYKTITKNNKVKRRYKTIRWVGGHFSYQDETGVSYQVHCGCGNHDRSHVVDKDMTL